MMPVILTALVAIGVHAASLLRRRRRGGDGPAKASTAGTDQPAVGARRPRLATRRPAA